MRSLRGLCFGMLLLMGFAAAGCGNTGSDSRGTAGAAGESSGGALGASGSAGSDPNGGASGHIAGVGGSESAGSGQMGSGGSAQGGSSQGGSSIAGGGGCCEPDPESNIVCASGTGRPPNAYVCNACPGPSSCVPWVGVGAGGYATRVCCP